MKEPWIIDAVRTPIGRHGGALAAVRRDDLGAIVLKALVDRTGVPASEVEDIYMGSANQSGEDNRNVERMSAILAGFPLETGGCTVNRLCGPGLEAVAAAARCIWAGEADVYIGSGRRVDDPRPLGDAKGGRGIPPGEPDRLRHIPRVAVHQSPTGRDGTHESMGETAENLAQHYAIPREAQDRFAFRSHEKAVLAMNGGHFEKEIIPVPTKKGLVETDEGPRRDSTLEKLATLKPVFRMGGTVTAGNSSTLNDGAAAALLVSGDYAQAGALGTMMPWRHVFLVFALPPLVAAVLVWRLIPEPERDHGLSDPRWPFRRVLRLRDFWLLGLAGTMPVYVQFSLATWAPLMFAEVGVTDLGRSASLASLQGLAAPLGLLASGLVADRLYQRGVHLASSSWRRRRCALRHRWPGSGGRSSAEAPRGSSPPCFSPRASSCGAAGDRRGPY